MFDPFGSDPAIVAMGRSDIKHQSFNPEVCPFTPMSDLGSWRVIAAEYTGEMKSRLIRPVNYLTIQIFEHYF